MLRYLDALRKRNSRALEAGFAAIISDFAATALCGCIQGPGLYEWLIDSGTPNAAA